MLITHERAERRLQKKQPKVEYLDRGSNMPSQKHILDLIKENMSHIVNVLYSVMLVYFVISEFMGWTYLDDIGTISTIRAVFTKCVPYLPAAMTSIILLDAYRNGLKLQKILAFVFGLFLVTKLNAYAFNGHFVYLFWFIIAYPSTLSIRKAVIITLISSCILSALTILLFCFGLIQENAFVQHGVLRHSLGFGQPNWFSFILSSLVMAWIYLKSATWRIRDVLISLTLFILIFAVCNGRSALGYGIIQIILTSIFCLGSIPKRIKTRISSVLFKGATWLFPILAFLSFATLPLTRYMQGTVIYDVINEFLTGRLDLALIAFDKFGIPIFSQPFTSFIAFDNSFLYIAWTCGIIALIYIAMLYVLGGKGYERNNDLPMAIYTVLFLLHCFTEVIFFPIIMNITILSVGAVLAGAPTGAKPMQWREQKNMKDESASM